MSSRKLRILLVITRLVRGGAPNVVLSIAEGLVKRGHSCAIATGPETGREGELFSRAKELGLNVINIPGMVREVSPVRDLAALVDLKRVISEGRYDVVHTHTSKAGLLGRAAAWLAGVRAVVHSPHGHIFAQRGNIPGVSDRPVMKKIFYWAERAAARLCDHTVCLSANEKHELQGMCLARPGRVSVIRNAVDVAALRSAAGLEQCRKRMRAVDLNCSGDGAERQNLHSPPFAKGGKELGRERTVEPSSEFRVPRAALPVPTSGFQLSTSDFIVGVAGRLAAEKGVSVLLEAMKDVLARVPKARLVVAGDGPERPALERQARDLGIDNRVAFLGMRADLPRVLAALDVFVLPSLYEGFGLVVLEAMAVGVPVIATRVGGVPEVIEDGVTGLLVPAGDAKKLAEAVFRLEDNPRQAEALADRGSARLQTDFSLPAMIDAVEGLYFAVLRQV